MLKKKKGKKLEEGGDVNITSLMDVLTVLLFFLIMSSTVTSLQIPVPEGVTLPSATIEETPRESVKVSLTTKDLLVNDKSILKLEGGRIPASALQDERVIKSLKTELDKEFQKSKEFFKEVADKDASLLPTPPILIQADKKTPFALMKLIYYTAAVSGFGEFQFVVTSDSP